MKFQSPSKRPEAEVNPFVGIDAKTAPYPGARTWSGGRFRCVGSPNATANCYHVMSRTCGGAVFFDDVEKEALVRLIWKMSEFLGVRVLTYCVMGNHFHILAEVPNRELWLARFSGEGGEEKLLAHLGSFYSRDFIGHLRDELAELRKTGQQERAEEKLRAFFPRFCDLSIWCKEIKERFTRWYNRRHQRKGTLWMDRFKSVLVEPGTTLRTMAAYIDLNPVRAKLVEDPKDYRWCGYAEALAGSRRAKRGLCRVMDVGTESWEKPAARDRVAGRELYRRWLYEDGRERQDRNGTVTKAGVDEETSAQVMRKEKGALPVNELIRQRVRHFSQGLAIGGKAWLEEVFLANRGRFGPKRKTGPRRVRGAEEEVYSLRELT